MTNNDTADMISRCIEEITRLRKTVEELSPKAAAYDSISRILDLLPRPPQDFSEDMVWRLRKQLEELRSEPAASDAEVQA